MFHRESNSRRSPAKIEDVKDAVKAFCVIYHTSRMYKTDHAVFKAAVEERMPVIKRALQTGQALSLDFHESQVWYGGITLEPGSSVFQRIAQEFAKIGIHNITMLPTLDANDLTRSISVIVGQGDEIRQNGLAAVLKREQIETVRSLDKSIQSGKQAVGERTAKSGLGVPSSAPPKKTGGGGVWDISDIDAADMETSQIMYSGDVPPTGEGHRPPAINNFVSGVLGALTRQEADLKEAVEIISTEFEHRVEERVATIRRESEKKIRRLETVKELVLTELERMEIAAVIMDSELQIIATNELARKLLEASGATTVESPLEDFVRSGMERNDISLGKEKRTAHLVTVAPTGSGSEIMLITLEKK